MAELNKLIKISMDDNQIKQVVSVDIMKLTADEMVISNQAEYECGADALGDISSRISDLDDMRKKIKSPILEAGRVVDDMFRAPLAHGRQAKEIIKIKMLDYIERVAIERKKAEILAEHIALEEKKKAEDLALAAMEDGDDEKAQQILDDVDLTPKPNAAIVMPKAKGVSTRTNWKASVTDIGALISAVAEGKAPITLLTVDISAANKFAKAVRDTLNVPGLIFYNDATLASRKKCLNNAAEEF